MLLSTITQFQYFNLFFIVLNIGLCGIILNYNNIILTIISIELRLLSINLNFIFYSLLISQLPHTEKLSSYKCGFDPFGDARNPFNIHFYLVSLLFILFLFYLDFTYVICDSISATNTDLILDIENDPEYVSKRTKVAFAVLVVSLMCFGLMFLYLNRDNSGSADTVLKLPTVNPNSSLGVSGN
jgi:NADH:ubiquinone oxidoreductase subunit 3 (subunit A)